MALRDLALLIGICLLWAGNSVMSKVLISHFGAPPLFYAACRFGMIVLATFPWLLPVPRQLGRMIAVGLTMGGGTMALAFMSLKTTTPSAFAVVSQLGVPMSAMLSVAMLGERIRWRRGLGIAVTLFGALIVMWDPSGLVPSVGMLFVAASALSGSLGAVLMKQVEGVSPRQFQAWVGFSSVWPLAFLSAATETGQGSVLAHAFWPFLGGVLVSSLLVSVVAHTAFYGLIQKYEVNLLQPLTLMTPLATIALGVLLTHDVLGPRMIVGTVVALSGVLIVALRRDHVLGPWALMRRAIP
jgi:drug/metabolite transporter (DMT)-like permease